MNFSFHIIGNNGTVFWSIQEKAEFFPIWLLFIGSLRSSKLIVQLFLSSVYKFFILSVGKSYKKWFICINSSRHTYSGYVVDCSIAPSSDNWLICSCLIYYRHAWTVFYKELESQLRLGNSDWEVRLSNFIRVSSC